jgi:hypothetical protein
VTPAGWFGHNWLLFAEVATVKDIARKWLFGLLVNRGSVQ